MSYSAPAKAQFLKWTPLERIVDVVIGFSIEVGIALLPLLSLLTKTPRDKALKSMLWLGLATIGVWVALYPFAIFGYSALAGALIGLVLVSAGFAYAQRRLYKL